MNECSSKIPPASAEARRQSRILRSNNHRSQQAGACQYPPLSSPVCLQPSSTPPQTPAPLQAAPSSAGTTATHSENPPGQSCAAHAARPSRRWRSRRLRFLLLQRRRGRPGGGPSRRRGGGVQPLSRDVAEGMIKGLEIAVYEQTV